MLEDEPRVLDGAGDRALLGAVELFLPLVRVSVLLRQRLEALHRVVYGLLPQQGRCGAVVLGQGSHLLPAGEGWIRTKSQAFSSLPPAGSVLWWL